MNRGENNRTMDDIIARQPYTCAGVTKAARGCKRPATHHFTKDDGTCVKHYCKQHAEGAGPTKLLRPLAWQYDHVEVYSS